MTNNQTLYATNDVLITATEAARICGLSRSAFYKLVSRGHAPKPIKLGRAARWRRQEIHDWIAAGCPAWGRMK